MSDLFSMLGTAARAMDAQRYGLDVTGQNIGNVNTPGYSRRSVVLQEVPPLDQNSPGGGVDVVGVTAARAPLIEARLRLEQPAAGREGVIAEHLSVVEAGLGTPGASLDAALGRFYNSFASLALEPSSSVARQQVTTEGQSLARAFNGIASRLNGAQHDADVELRSDLEQVNALAAQIADLNATIATHHGENTESLRDQQSVALSSLASLIDIGVLERQQGGVDVTIGNGRALVVGAHTYELDPSPTAQGFASIISHGADVVTDVTAEITGGRIGGLIQLRDAIVPTYIDSLDQLAYAVASDVNSLHRTGFDLQGNAGTDFFAQPAVAAGAARGLAVSAAIVADSRLIVAGSTPAAGNNDLASAIAALQDAPMTGSTAHPVDAWGQLVYRVAADAQTATQGLSGHQQVAQQLEALRDQISGVSLDEEAAMLMRFQRAYEANARFFRATDQALDILMQMVGA